MTSGNDTNIDIMVCVTKQRACERLIKRAVSMNEEEERTLAVVHVALTGEDLLGNPDEGDALDILFLVSKNNGAQMHMLRSDTLTKTLVDFAKEHKVKVLILGKSRTTGKKMKQIKSAFKKHMPNIEIHILAT